MVLARNGFELWLGDGIDTEAHHFVEAVDGR